MKLDVNVLRYLSRDDFRTLTAVEMGQKNVIAALLSFLSLIIPPFLNNIALPHISKYIILQIS